MNHLNTLFTNIRTPNLAETFTNQTFIRQPTDSVATGFPLPVRRC